RDPSHATTSELSDAIDELLASKSISVQRTDSIGCSIKWKI
ncbi:MAG: thioredoxin family protein, partial [Euryarchaeota archaeon]|nr:thioredoxin family protein [Euryarchaeota archaeon]